MDPTKFEFYQGKYHHVIWKRCNFLKKKHQKFSIRDCIRFQRKFDRKNKIYYFLERKMYTNNNDVPRILLDFFLNVGSIWKKNNFNIKFFKNLTWQLKCWRPLNWRPPHQTSTVPDFFASPRNTLFLRLWKLDGFYKTAIFVNDVGTKYWKDKFSVELNRMK